MLVFRKRQCVNGCLNFYILGSSRHSQAICPSSLWKLPSAVSAVTFSNLGEPAPEFKKTMSRPCCLLFPSHCCFHSLFSHSQTVFQLIPIIPDREFRGAAWPTSYSKPNTELEPTGSQVELLCLTFFHQNKKANIEDSVFVWHCLRLQKDKVFMIFYINSSRCEDVLISKRQ